MNKKLYLIIFLLILFAILSCKKINLLSPSIIPPPTQFPNNNNEDEIPNYPIPTPLPVPPPKIQRKKI